MVLVTRTRIHSAIHKNSYNLSIEWKCVHTYSTKVTWLSYSLCLFTTLTIVRKWLQTDIVHVYLLLMQLGKTPKWNLTTTYSINGMLSIEWNVIANGVVSIVYYLWEVGHTDGFPHRQILAVILFELLNCHVLPKTIQCQNTFHRRHAASIFFWKIKENY